MCSCIPVKDKRGALQDAAMHIRSHSSKYNLTKCPIAKKPKCGNITHHMIKHSTCHYGPRDDTSTEQYEVHPKSNWKMWTKKEWLQLGGKFFFSFSRHPLLIWLHCYFHHYKTLKAVTMATAAIVVLTPANFYHFQRPKFNFQPLSLLRTLAKTCRNKNYF